MNPLDQEVQKRIDEDSAFQESIASMNDAERDEALTAKRAEVANIVFTETQTRAAENETKFEDQRKRALKAEEDLKKFRPAGGEGAGGEGAPDAIDPKDLYAMMNAQVPEDDFDEVVKAAKLLGKPIKEALADEMVKGILQRKKEERTSAAAANGGGGRPGPKQISDSELLAASNRGEIPEPGSPEAERLFHLRHPSKSQKR